MSRPVNQQPSAIMHAAGEAVSELGKVALVKATFGTTEGQEGVGAGQLNVLATIDPLKEELLLRQEQMASVILSTRPWVREIKRTGSVGTRGDMVVMLQIDQAPSATVPAAEASTETPPAPTQGAAQ
jgi:hypothetical protein